MSLLCRFANSSDEDEQLLPSRAVWLAHPAALTEQGEAMATMSSAEQNLTALAEGDAPVLETLAQMTLDTYERSGLDPQTYTLVRLAALAAMDAAPVSYLLNLGAAEEIGVPIETVQGMLVAIAPVVGSARVVSAAGKMVRGIGLVADPDASS
jgi:alkylhydroperoxidase/carboxymuconolactone decarboxylase family protein YurZ